MSEIAELWNEDFLDNGRISCDNFELGADIEAEIIFTDYSLNVRMYITLYPKVAP